MSDLPIPIGGTALPAAGSTDALDSADRYAGEDIAPATRRAYESDWRDFMTWCAVTGAHPLPASPEAIGAYLAQLADRGLKASTIGRRTAAIAWGHRRKDLVPPTSAAYVRRVGRGIRRTVGTAIRQKSPITIKILLRMLRQIPETPRGLRDRALLALGFAAAMRRSELAGIAVADLRREPDGIVILLRRSKTDQEGRGREVPVLNGRKLRPVAVLDAWLAVAGIVEGPVFRAIDKGGRVGTAALSGRSASETVKRWVEASGLDPDDYAGHSLRAGMVTSMLEDGVDLLKAMQITGHKNVQTLQGYDRRAKLFKDHAGKGFL